SNTGDAAGDTYVSIENLAGSAFADHLSGDANPNKIDGGPGIDTMTGGAGNDSYYVDNPADIVVESPNEGNDAVYATSDFTLPTNVEALFLLAGATNINGAGNNDPNYLVGNSGNNTLDGKGGDDTMIGGDGNDIYFIDSTGDLIIENPNEGNDIVYASVDY